MRDPILPQKKQRMTAPPNITEQESDWCAQAGGHWITHEGSHLCIGIKDFNKVPEKMRDEIKKSQDKFYGETWTKKRYTENYTYTPTELNYEERKLVQTLEAKHNFLQTDKDVEAYEKELNGALIPLRAKYKKYNEELAERLRTQDEIYRSVYNSAAVDDLIANNVVRNKGQWEYVSFSVDPTETEHFGAIRMVFDKNKVENNLFPVEYIPEPDYLRQVNKTGENPVQYIGKFANEQEIRAHKSGVKVSSGGLKRIEVVEYAESVFNELKSKYPDIEIIKVPEKQYED